MSSHQARKRFGQNFLQDSKIVNAIIASMRLSPDDQVIEIGPGLGALTEPLLKQLKHLHVLEIDRDLVARLRELHPPERLTVVEGDALEYDLNQLSGVFKVVGNLPYNISTPLLFHLASVSERVQHITVMLQKEVVDRIVAEPDTEAYGRLSVMLQLRFSVQALFEVPPESFKPVPSVDSAVVQLTPRADLLAELKQIEAFELVVARAFNQRRKTLRNALKEVISLAQFAELEIDPQRRGETLSVSDYIRLANALQIEG
jgi:16S rRNA (adenine1518-N6/adenine1519-N6)-dimethyltransferase